MAGGCVALGLILVVAAFASARSGNTQSRRLESARQRGGRKDAVGPAILIRREQQGGGLDRLVGRWMPRRDVLEARLQRTGKKLTVTHYFMAIVAIAVVMTAASIYVFGFGRALSVLLGIAVGLMIPHVVVGFLGARRLNAFTALFPETIDLLVRGLRSGLPIAESIGTVAREIGDPVGTEFRLIDQSIKLGRSIEEAMWDTAQRIDTAEFKFFIIALSVQRETGGNLAETLENLSDILRKRRQMRLKVKALSSEAKASAYIIGSLPFIMFGLLFVVSNDYVMQLLRDPRGLVMVGIGLFMIGLGWGVMFKMVRFEI
jgi:tight adherence protein B